MKSKYLPVVLSLALISFRSNPDNERIAYPDGYRDWTHVKTYIVGPKNPAFKVIGGFNHVYGNEKAMKGYQSGDFPDGSVIVSDVIATVEDSITIREANRDHIDVMMKENGTWIFETFK
ncbi:MAG TPA: cytochrome P460 family protein, partial [Cyclobacteriaceae bacterium]|nr:cytochrome P460 family protein [Cyclobacteriaceae bacterium]